SRKEFFFVEASASRCRRLRRIFSVPAPEKLRITEKIGRRGKKRRGAKRLSEFFLPGGVCSPPELLQLDLVPDLDQPEGVGQANDAPAVSHRENRSLSEIGSRNGNPGGRRRADPVGADGPDPELLAPGVPVEGDE